MSIDRYHFVPVGSGATEIAREEAQERIKESHNTIEIQLGGVDHLFIFQSGAECTASFEEWRREPCGNIVHTLGGVEQAGGRLPVSTPGGKG